MHEQLSSAPLIVEPNSVIRYVTAVLALGVPILAIPVLAGMPQEPFLLLVVFLLLLGGAVWTARRSGPGGARRLFRGLVHWRIGWANWALAVVALPAATIGVAILTGTFRSPPDGWLITLGSYAFFTFVFGALIVNLWEETGWHGLVQRHLMQRHGLLKGSVLTAIPFALLHLPLAFNGADSLGEALAGITLIVVLAPALRYLLGRLDIASGGSLLVVGIMHASHNATGSLDVLVGDWQFVAGLVVVAGMVLTVDLVRSRPSRTEPSAPQDAFAG